MKYFVLLVFLLMSYQIVEAQIKAEDSTLNSEFKEQNLKKVQYKRQPEVVKSCSPIAKRDLLIKIAEVQRRNNFVKATLLAFLLMITFILLTKPFQFQQLKKQTLPRNQFRALLALLARDLLNPLSALHCLYHQVEFFPLKMQQFLLLLEEKEKNARRQLPAFRQWIVRQVESPEVEIQAFSITLFLEEILAKLKSSILAKDLELKIQFPKSLNLAADQKMTALALHNLLANGIQQSPHQGNLYLTITDRPDFVKFEILGQGPG